MGPTRRASWSSTRGCRGASTSRGGGRRGLRARAHVHEAACFSAKLLADQQGELPVGLVARCIARCALHTGEMVRRQGARGCGIASRPILRHKARLAVVAHPDESSSYRGCVGVMALGWGEVPLLWLSARGGVLLGVCAGSRCRWGRDR